MRWLMTPPNLLTLARLSLTPLVSVLLLERSYGPALLVFGAAGVTDALDGFLARRFRWSTPVGAYLDPIADKILLVTAYLSLGITGALPAWLVAVVLGRDVLILTAASAFLLFTNQRGFSPSRWGKISTIVQVVTVVAVICYNAFPALALDWLTTLLVALTAAATAGSGLHYASRGFRMLRSRSSTVSA